MELITTFVSGARLKAKFGQGSHVMLEQNLHGPKPLVSIFIEPVYFILVYFIWLIFRVGKQRDYNFSFLLFLLRTEHKREGLFGFVLFTFPFLFFSSDNSLAYFWQ